MPALRITFNHRLEKDMHYSVSSEVVVDDEYEAEQEGKRFWLMFQAVQRGMVAGSEETKEDP